MLVNFTVGNYRSFRERKTLSMEATCAPGDNGLVFSIGNHTLLSTAALYGANSSGKSNFLKALETFVRFFSESSGMSSVSSLDFTPFLLDENSRNNPSFFEIEIISFKKKYYRYGFEVTNKEVMSEWLYKRTSSKEVCLFLREQDEISIYKTFKEGAGLESRTRNNALFLAVCESFNGEIAMDVALTIHSIFPLSGIRHDAFGNRVRSLDDGLTKRLTKNVGNILSRLDIGFYRFEIPSDSELVRRIKAYTFHHRYDEKGNICGEETFTMKEHESEGTNKLYDVLTGIAFAMVMGGTLVVDELDCKLHPLISSTLIKLFNDSEINNSHAQLIFTTHDTNLLSANVLRRDQVWFVEKDKNEVSDLYALVEFKDGNGDKQNASVFETDYIRGRYGAIPYINFEW